MIPYDVVTIGNHELYSYAVTKETHDNVERWWVLSEAIGIR